MENKDRIENLNQRIKYLKRERKLLKKQDRDLRLLQHCKDIINNLDLSDSSEIGKFNLSISLQGIRSRVEDILKPFIETPYLIP